jgi:glycosyltransferase involved in cell wall biosynthesis
VPPDDPDALAEALGELEDSPERRRSLGEVARARAVERFSIDRMVGETVAVYSEALAA